MAVYGSIEAYIEERELWTQYAERLDYYFVANSITDDEKQRAVFLTLIGPAAYGLLRSLAAPTPLSTLSYDALTAILRDHYNPRPAEIIERYKFNSRCRKQEETLSIYVAELRKIAEHCNFGETLDIMLRDRIVCGINDDIIQRRLLAETALTLTRAIELGLAMEAAAKNATDLQVGGTSNFSSINKVDSSFAKRRFTRRDHVSSGRNVTQRESTNAYNSHTKPEGCSQKPIVLNKNSCFRCGSTQHNSNACKHINTKCNACDKLGHLVRVCLSTGRASTNKFKPKHYNTAHVHALADTNSSAGTSSISRPEYTVFHTESCVRAPPPMTALFNINGVNVEMEIDSGAAYSLINHECYLRNVDAFGPLVNSNITLSTYTGQHLLLAGKFRTPVTYNDVTIYTEVHVVTGGKLNLCGRDWINEFQIFSTKILVHTEHTTVDSRLKTILDKHHAVFSPELGCFKDVQVHLYQKASTTPAFYRPRSIPFALREKVTQELDRLESDGVIEKVRVSKWAAPIVPVLKKNNTVRICGDFKLTVNKATDTEQYPLPKADDLFAKLAGGKKFSKLDLRDAYNQLQVDVESRELLVINTLKGLYRYTRLPFGVSSAPAIFQRHIEELLNDVDFTSAFQDDCLVSGTSDDDHLDNLDKALTLIETAGLKLRREKCEFMLSSIEYLGHELSSEGLSPTSSKIQAINEAPVPVDVGQLKSFLGLVTYYSKFLPNMATVLEPLYKLTRKQQPWSWTEAQDTAFNLVKSMLTSHAVLTHYDPEAQLFLHCDASPSGLGAVLSHSTVDGDKPVAYASRVLLPAEVNYSQIEKEALALVFAATRFRDYLLGRHFFLVTDHKPLTSLFNENKAIPSTASARIQRWAVTLSAYDYSIQYRPGLANMNADALSRLPVPDNSGFVPEPQELVLLISDINHSTVTAVQIKTATAADKLLCSVLTYIHNGWPSGIKSVHEDLKPFWLRRNELTVHHGIIVWNNRVLVPASLRSPVLQQLHEEHLGICHLKHMARKLVWWPGIDAQIESLVNTCHTCQQVAPSNPKTIYHWPDSDEPWSRIHIDYAGPIDGHMVLVLVDSCTKWIEARAVKSATSEATAAVLRSIFATFGIPLTLVSDNGTSFTGQNFRNFTSSLGIRQVFTAPYHPSSNGAAERTVCTVKAALLKLEGGTLQERLDRFLFSHRNSFRRKLNCSPAEMIFKYSPRTRLHMLHPNCLVSDKTDSSNLKRKRKFIVGQTVWVKNFLSQSKWSEGTVDHTIGNSMFAVKTSRGCVRRHQDQLRHRHIVPDKQGNIVQPASSALLWQPDYSPNPRQLLFQQIPATTVPLRASTRVRRPPNRLNL